MTTPQATPRSTPQTTPPINNGPIVATPSFAQPVAGYASGYSSITLHYLEVSPILVRGTVTGRQYQFSGKQPDQSVDATDAEALLSTRFFRRKY